MSSPIPSFRSDESRSPYPSRQDKTAARSPLPAQGLSPLPGRQSRPLGSSSSISSTATHGGSNGGNAFSRFLSKMEFKSPAFGLQKQPQQYSEKRRPRVSLLGT